MLITGIVNCIFAENVFNKTPKAVTSINYMTNFRLLVTMLFRSLAVHHTVNFYLQAFPRLRSVREKTHRQLRIFTNKSEFIILYLLYKKQFVHSLGICISITSRWITFIFCTVMSINNNWHATFLRIYFQNPIKVFTATFTTKPYIEMSCFIFSQGKYLWILKRIKIQKYIRVIISNSIVIISYSCSNAPYVCVIARKYNTHSEIVKQQSVDREAFSSYRNMLGSSLIWLRSFIKIVRFLKQSFRKFF